MSYAQVIEYLRTHTLKQLYDNHGVKYRIDDARTKLSLNYDQLKVRSGDPIGECCRGIIIRPDFVLKQGNIPQGMNLDYTALGNCHVVARPMDRFYNQGDEAQAKIDKLTMNVLEKLDGTMCILYFDRLKSDWFVATRSIPEANLPIRVGDIVLENKTFATLFWEAFDETIKDSGLTRQETLDNLMLGWTYIFELTTPHNRVIVPYDDKRVTLLAARQTRNGKEISILSDAYGMKQLPFPRPRTWNLCDPLAVAALADSFKPKELEGFVVIDDKFNRVKVKNSSWVLSSKTKDGVISSKRNVLKAIFKGVIDDIIPMVDPETHKFLKKLQDSVRDFISTSEQRYNDWTLQCEPGDHKAFASLVKASQVPVSGAYYMTFRGKCSSIRDYFHNNAVKDKFSEKTLDAILKYITI